VKLGARLAVPALILTIVSLRPIALMSQGTPAWRYTTSGDISGLWLAPNAGLVVLTADQIAAVDPATGTPAWTRAGVHSAREHWWFMTSEDSTEGVLDLGDRLEAVDLKTGVTRWDTPTLGIAAVKGYLGVDGRRLLLVYGASAQDSSVLFGVDLGLGQVRWRHVNPFVVAPKRYRTLTRWKDEFGAWLGGEQSARPIADSTFLLYISEDGPVLVNINSGAFVWTASSLAGKRPPAWRDGYPLMLITDSIAYIPREKELHAIRLRDGTPVWSKPAEFPSRVRQLELTTAGLVVRGVRRDNDAIKDGSFVDLLDPATGASRWPKQYKHGWSVFHAHDAPSWISPFVVRGERVYFAAESKLVGISLGQGSVAELGKVKFKGDEEPSEVQSRTDGILLLAPQNVVLEDTSGTVRFQAYYPGPSTGGLLGKIFGRRQLGAYENRDFVYWLTTDKDSAGQTRPCLVKTSKDQNHVEGRVWLGEASADYVVDGGAAYVVTAPREIAAFKW
jgi:outer membrane protein assembly factor BamB